MPTLKIALIHATALAVQPVEDVFAQLWPEADCRNVLDESLTTDLQAAGGLDAAMMARFTSMARDAQAQGAQGILFTCSAFGAAIDAAKMAVPLPILKPNEAMFDEALQHCAALGGSRRIGLLTTFAPAAAPMLTELRDAIALRQSPITVVTACADGAMDCLRSGDALKHDTMILDAARALPPCDVVLLGQFSMARAQALVAQNLSTPILTSPESAVRSLQRALSLKP
jgi:Asp/Glu/hydantoin racemase